MKVSVIGTGYVGLVTGACFADRGHEVICVDNDASKVAALNKGKPPIHEAGLEELLQRNVGSRLSGSTDLAAAVRDTDITLIAVGTPFDGQHIDLTYVRTVALEIGTALRDKDTWHVVVVKSTVVPGTTDDVVSPILEEASGKRAGTDFGVGMNPEFLTEGTAVADFMNPDRIVIGGADVRTQEVLAELYASFPDAPRVVTNNKTAEMIKYASNSLLATMISFANEFSDLCIALGGVDVAEVMDGVHRSLYLTAPASPDRTQAPIARFLEAGCGYGGSCLPKDTQALAAQGEEAGSPMPLLEAVIDTNRRRPERVLDLIRRGAGDIAGKAITVLGLAFKPDTDDVRESPAFPVMRALIDARARVTAYDPVALETARAAFGEDDVRYVDSLDKALDGADVVVIITRWPEFKRLPAMLGGMSEPPLVVDGRRMLDKNALDRYEGIGLG